MTETAGIYLSNLLQISGEIDMHVHGVPYNLDLIALSK